MSSKNKRAPKTLVQQYELYVQYIEKKPHFRTGNCHPNHLKQLWRDLTIELNAMGVERTAMEWKTIFNNWKNQTRYFFRKMNHDKSERGQYRRILTPLEERMLFAFDGHVVDKIGIGNSTCVVNNDDSQQTNSEINTTIDEEIEDESKNSEKCIKKRAPKTLVQQYERYVEYLEKYPEFRSGKHDAPQRWQQLWTNLNNELNGMGVERSVEAWQRIFENWKYQIRYTVRKLQNPAAYGISGSTRKRLTPLEERLMSVDLLPVSDGSAEKNHSPHHSRPPITVVYPESDATIDGEMEKSDAARQMESPMLMMEDENDVLEEDRVVNADEDDSDDDDNKNVVLDECPMSDGKARKRPSVTKLNSHSTPSSRNPNKTTERYGKANRKVGSKSVETALVLLSNDVCDIKLMFRNMLNNQERIIRLLENKV